MQPLRLDPRHKDALDLIQRVKQRGKFEPLHDFLQAYRNKTMKAHEVRADRHER